MSEWFSRSLGRSMSCCFFFYPSLCGSVTTGWLWSGALRNENFHLGHVRHSQGIPVTPIAPLSVENVSLSSPTWTAGAPTPRGSGEQPWHVVLLLSVVGKHFLAEGINLSGGRGMDFSDEDEVWKGKGGTARAGQPFPGFSPQAQGSPWILLPPPSCGRQHFVQSTGSWDGGEAEGGGSAVRESPTQDGQDPAVIWKNPAAHSDRPAC